MARGNLEAWREVAAGPLPGGTCDKPEELPPQRLHELRSADFNWQDDGLTHLTPLHLAVSGDAPEDDAVANALRVQTLDLFLLYTANRIDFARPADSAPEGWRGWRATYEGAGYRVEVQAASPSRLLGADGTTGAFIKLVEWCYGEEFPRGKLSFLQSAVARALRGIDLQRSTEVLAQQAGGLLASIELDWKMFVEGKLDEFNDHVRALEDYVAATVESFSDQVSGLIKNLSETMLAAVVVLLGAFIAALASKESTPQILAISVTVYVTYLLVFPLIYNMSERQEYFNALVRQFEERRQRFVVILTADKVTAIVGGRVDESQRRFRGWFRRIAGTYIAVAALASLTMPVAVLRLTPSPVDSLAYSPPAGPALRGALAPNTALRRSRRIAEGRLAGSEDVAVDADGRLFTGTADGRVMRVTPGANGDDRVEVFAETGGRPLGLRIRAATASSPWTLVVADAKKGLLAVDAGGGVKTLAAGAGGVPFGFTNDLDLAADGRIYFSDSSTRFGIDRYLYDLLESRPRGRLLLYEPAKAETKVLLDGLFFANGVALARGEEFVLVAETYRYRIRRYWLKGPRAGTSDLFADDLPGFPDNLSTDRLTGHFWVALFTVRNPLMDRLHPHPWLKEQLAKLPGFLWPKPEPYGLVLEMDETGRILRSLHDPGGRRVRGVTSASPHGGGLYLGSLDEGITLWPGGP